MVQAATESEADVPPVSLWRPQLQAPVVAQQLHEHPVRLLAERFAECTWVRPPFAGSIYSFGVVGVKSIPCGPYLAL